MVPLARWAELLFAGVSLVLWLALPFPPTKAVMWNWVLLTISSILGVAFFFWLRKGSRAAWAGAAVWAALLLAHIGLGIARQGLPAWSSPAIGLSFLLVYTMALTQAVVLICCVALSWKWRGGSRAIGV